MSGAPDYAVLLKLLPSLRVFPDALGWTTLTAEEAAKVQSLGFEAQAGRYKLPPFPYELVADTMFEHLSIGWDNRQAWSNSRRTVAPPATPQARPETRDLQSESLGSGKVHHAKEEAERVAVKTVSLPPTSRLDVEIPPLELPFATPGLSAPPRFEPAVLAHPRPEPPAQEKPSGSEEAREAEEARRAEVVMVARKILKAVQKAGGRLAKRRAQQWLSRHRGIFKEALGELIARGLVALEGLVIVEVGRVMRNGPDARLASQENRAQM